MFIRLLSILTRLDDKIHDLALSPPLTVNCYSLSVEQYVEQNKYSLDSLELLECFDKPDKPNDTKHVDSIVKEFTFCDNGEWIDVSKF